MIIINHLSTQEDTCKKKTALEETLSLQRNTKGETNKDTENKSITKWTAEPQIESQLSSYRHISTLEVLHEYEEYKDHPSPVR